LANNATEKLVVGDNATNTEIVQLAQFLNQLDRNGYSSATIKSYTKFLTFLIRHGASLRDSESVKALIKAQKWAESTKHLVSVYYQQFAKKNGIAYERPRYKATRKLPFIPLESEIDALIASCGPVTSTMLELLKETGMRIGEALRLEWANVDTERRTVTVNDPEKNGNARVLKVPEHLIARLNKLPKKNAKVFGGVPVSSFETNFYGQRKTIARKLENPRLLGIHFHTLRHWKGSTEYAKTRSERHVKELLGHKSILNTDLYVQLLPAMERDEYYSATAKTIDEAARLVESGFEYVTEFDGGVKLFKRRK
jgi:integrase